MLKPQEAFSHERGLDLLRLTDEQLEELYVLAGGKPYLAEERKAKAEHDAQVAEAKRARADASLEASTGLPSSPVANHDASESSRTEVGAAGVGSAGGFGRGRPGPAAAPPQSRPRPRDPEA
jgi:hypothetical protein